MELQTLIENVDKEGTGKLNFDSFYSIAGVYKIYIFLFKMRVLQHYDIYNNCHYFQLCIANFLEEEDDEAMQNELKEAFRLYDKEGWSAIKSIDMMR